MGIVLRNVKALINDTGEAKQAEIRIEGTRIVDISDSAVSVHPDDTVVQGRSKLALPGLVNSHTHLSTVLLRGLADDLSLENWLCEHIWPAEKLLTAEDVYWGSLLALAELIRSGTTMCADMYFHMDKTGKAVTEAGLRALLSYGIVAERLDTRGKEELRKAEETVVNWDGAAGGRIRVAVSPHAPYSCGRDVWEAAIGLARKNGVVLHSHVAESRTEVKTCMQRWGKTPVKALESFGAFSGPFVAAHCVHVDDDDIRVLAEKEVNVAHCPKSNAKLGNGIAPVSKLLAAGVGVSLGTDGAASNNSLDMIEEMRAAALLGKAVNEDPTALSARQVISMATQGGRRAIGAEPCDLSEGAPADVVLIDLEEIGCLPVYEPLSTLVYAARSQDVTDVIVDGRFVMRDRELMTIDEEKVKAEVRSRFGKFKR